MPILKSIALALGCTAVLSVFAASARADDGNWRDVLRERDDDFAGVEWFSDRHDRDDDQRRRHRRPFTIKIIGFNDYHGNLQSPGTFGVNTSTPAAQRPRRRRRRVHRRARRPLKAQNPHNVVVGAGDFIGATPLISALFFDEPAIETLNHIGVEFNAVGNHEFDKGSAELLRLQNGGCKPDERRARSEQLQGPGLGTPGTFDGREVQVPVGQRDRRPPPASTLLPAYGIKTFRRRDTVALHRHDAEGARRPS